MEGAGPRSGRIVIAARHCQYSWADAAAAISLKLASRKLTLATVSLGSDLAVRAMALGSVKTGAGKRWSQAEAARFTAAYRDFLPPPFDGRTCGFSLSPIPGL